MLRDDRLFLLYISRICAICFPLVGCGLDRDGDVSARSEPARHVGATLARALHDPRPVPPAPACPPEMAFVSGQYCTDVEQHCLEWIDPPNTRYAKFRCARYVHPARCVGERQPMRFCIDRTELKEDSSSLPIHHASWSAAERACHAIGKRLCNTDEWQFACEGEEMRPYPYGFDRDSSACNVDIMRGLGRVGRLVDHRLPAGSLERCKSPFGVYDMAGNVDEWATIPNRPVGTREVMKGSWWLPGKHHCRAEQAGHGAHYGGTESGVRCCADAKPDSTR